MHVHVQWDIYKRKNTILKASNLGIDFEGYIPQVLWSIATVPCRLEKERRRDVKHIVVFERMAFLASTVIQQSFSRAGKTTADRKKERFCTRPSSCFLFKHPCKTKGFWHSTPA
jgi:hypothetical protein